MELRIYIRHTQFFAFEKDLTNALLVGDPIIYTGQNTATLKPVRGTVPIKEWQDVTDCVSDLHTLSLTWTVDRDEYGNLTSDRFNKLKTASGSLQFEDRAYHIIKGWLVNHISAPLNAIDVKIEHVGCGYFDELIIKPSQVNWCEDGRCYYEVTLQQKDMASHCIQKTLIDDNWQGWFHKHTTKKHPRFLYCNEGRPIGWLVALWYISTVMFIFMFSLTPIIWSIQLLINIVKDIIDVISWLFGGNPNFGDNWTFFDPTEVMFSFYTESSGCGFNHVAPLIRDYITNVCDKCGVKVDGVTAPIFFAKQISIDTSSEREQGIKLRNNPYYNATYLAPTVNRGFRRFKHLFGKALNPVYYWSESNAPLLSLEQFLDEIKMVFNAEWRLQNDHLGQPTLYFWRKDWFTNGRILYDFTDENTRLKILKGMCFNWNENNMPAYMTGLYQDDAKDSAGNQAKRFMNDMVSIGSSINNVLFNGDMDKTTKLGATKFRLDGIDTDYLMSATHTLDNLAITAPLMVDAINNLIIKKTLKQFDYALLLSDDFNGLGKIIIWDEDSGYDDAFAINTVGASIFNGYGPNDEFLPMPQMNPTYNKENKQFNEIHEIKTNSWSGEEDLEGMAYTVRNWGKQARLINYPMYFSSKFKDNLFDWFHWIDDYSIKPAMNATWEVVIGLCCEDLKKLGVFDGGGRIQLLERVKIPNDYYNDGIITEIKVDYNGGDGNGQDGSSLGKCITIKGKV